MMARRLTKERTMSTDRDKAQLIVNEWVALLHEAVAKPPGSITRLVETIASALAAERAALLKVDGPLVDRISRLVYEHSTIDGDVLVVEDGQALRQAIELLVVGERAALAKELESYTEHLKDCRSSERYPSPPCDCGLVATLERAAGGGE